MGSLCNADGSKIMTEDDGYETIVPDLSASEVTQADCEAVLEAVRKVRDGYASQAKFADHEPASYFREFVQRLDAALTTPAPAVSRDDQALFDGDEV